MRHLVTVVAVLLVLLAGCTGTLPGTAEEPSPTSTTADRPGDCSESARTTVDPYRDDVEPSPLPDRPTTLNRSSVEAYVVAYEEAYARNGALRAESTQVSTVVGNVRVEETADGWTVHLTSRTNTWVRGTDTGDGTPTEVHGDGPRVPVVYRLTDDRLVRAEGEYGETPSAAGGATVECA